MTMRITKDQKIGGFPARDVRDMFKGLLRRRPDGRFSQPWFDGEIYWLRVKGKEKYKGVTYRACIYWLRTP